MRGLLPFSCERTTGSTDLQFLHGAVELTLEPLVVAVLAAHGAGGAHGALVAGGQGHHGAGLGGRARGAAVHLVRVSVPAPAPAAAVPETPCVVQFVRGLLQEHTT